MQTPVTLWMTPFSDHLTGSFVRNAGFERRHLFNPAFLRKDKTCSQRRAIKSGGDKQGGSGVTQFVCFSMRALPPLNVKIQGFSARSRLSELLKNFRTLPRAPARIFMGIGFTVLFPRRLKPSLQDYHLQKFACSRFPGPLPSSIKTSARPRHQKHHVHNLQISTSQSLRELRLLVPCLETCRKIQLLPTTA